MRSFHAQVHRAGGGGGGARYAVRAWSRVGAGRVVLASPCSVSSSRCAERPLRAQPLRRWRRRRRRSGRGRNAGWIAARPGATHPGGVTLLNSIALIHPGLYHRLLPPNRPSAHQLRVLPAPASVPGQPFQHQRPDPTGLPRQGGRWAAAGALAGFWWPASTRMAMGGSTRLNSRRACPTKEMTCRVEWTGLIVS